MRVRMRVCAAMAKVKCVGEVLNINAFPVLPLYILVHFGHLPVGVWNVQARRRLCFILAVSPNNKRNDCGPLEKDARPRIVAKGLCIAGRQNNGMSEKDGEVIVVGADSSTFGGEFKVGSSKPTYLCILFDNFCCPDLNAYNPPHNDATVHASTANPLTRINQIRRAEREREGGGGGGGVNMLNSIQRERWQTTRDSSPTFLGVLFLRRSGRK